MARTTELEDTMLVPEIARRMYCRRETVWRWIKNGCQGRRLRAIRAGRRFLVSEADLEDFVRVSDEAA